jgi:hypothetical protein
MKMSEGYIKAFPKFSAFVSRQFPLLVRNSKILDAFQQAAGEAPRQYVEDALRWGNLPWVGPAELENISGSHTPYSDVIKIHYLRVLEFEAGEGLLQAPNGQMVQFLCVVLLHELAHWIDDYDNQRNEDEAGHVFEKLVWGGTVNPVTSLTALEKKFGTWEAVKKQRAR